MTEEEVSNAIAILAVHPLWSCAVTVTVQSLADALIQTSHIAESAENLGLLEGCEKFC